LSPEFTGYSHWAMGFAAISVTLVIFLRRKIGWVTAAFFLAFYAAYLTGLVLNWDFDELKYLVIERPAA
jgi:hypothetical protein